MTYLDLINEWELYNKKEDPRFFVSIFKGENWDSFSIEHRAMSLIEILTSPSVEVSTENL